MSSLYLLEAEDEVHLITREEFDKRMNYTIDAGDVDEICELVTPYQLTKCEMNCLEKSLEVSYKLRKGAKGPDAEDLMQMGAAVEDFAFHLLDPLKNDDDMRSMLKGQDFDRVIDKAVAFKQMKFLSHPVLYTLLKKRWKGRFYKIRSRSPFIWSLLNIWTAFDIFLFILIFPFLYLIRIIIVISNKISGKMKRDPFEYYLEYFTIPYFIFARDTLSYLVLLGLHYAVCLMQSPSVNLHQPTKKCLNQLILSVSSPQSSTCGIVDLLILVFFVGRFLMEIDQVVNVIIREEKKSWDSEFGGVKRRKTKWETLRKMMSKYVGDWWNLLDALSLVIFIIIMVLRLPLYENEGKNTRKDYRIEMAVAYLYGLNTIILTVRVIGNILESIKFTGSIQIALFHIIGALIAIFGQFLAVLFAFSFAITKTHLAGYNTTLDSEQTSKIWFKTLTDLTWSLLGDAKQESVNSTNSVSYNFAKVLYGIFLIMGVVMLLNMLIALLTNTYQKIENNAFYEWSHKKAITIRTYCTYHPVPVPFNIFSLTFKFGRHICRKVIRKFKHYAVEENRPENNINSKEFIDLIAYLQSEYFSVYGYFFPRTDGEKINDLVKETKGCRQLMGNVANRVFEYNLEERQHIAEKYRTDKWYSNGIKIDGQRLSYMECDCYRCKNHGPSEYNGAYLKEPLPTAWPKFEVLIQECGELRFITVGLVDTEWDPHDIPGSKGNSVGYRVHEGKIFDKNNRKTGRYVIDTAALRGDVIGCEIMYEEHSANSIPVHFTLNDRFIGEALLAIQDESGKPFQYCPFVGIGFEGISLSFRMRSKEPIPCGLTSTNEMVQNNSIMIESLKAMRKHEMEVLSGLTELFQGTKRSMDGMFSRIVDLKQEVDFLRGEVEFWKNQGSGSHIVDLHREIDFLRNEIKFWKDQVLSSKEETKKT